MFKTIIRIIVIVLIFLAICWIAGTTWHQFKDDIELQSPLNVFHINTPSVISCSSAITSNEEKKMCI